MSTKDNAAQIRLDDRLNSRKDKYHPSADSQRLAGFLTKEPWSGLIPLQEIHLFYFPCIPWFSFLNLASKKSLLRRSSLLIAQWFR